MKVLRFIVGVFFIITVACGGEGGSESQADPVDLNAGIDVDPLAGVDTSLGCGDAEDVREETAVVYDNGCPFTLNPGFEVSQQDCRVEFKKANITDASVNGAIDKDENYHFQIVQRLNQTLYDCVSQLISGDSQDAVRDYQFHCQAADDTCSLGMQFIDGNARLPNVVARVNAGNGCGNYSGNAFRFISKTQNTCNFELNGSFVGQQDGCHVRLFRALGDGDGEMMGSVDARSNFGIKFDDPDSGDSYECVEVPPCEGCSKFISFSNNATVFHYFSCTSANEFACSMIWQVE